MGRVKKKKKTHTHTPPIPATASSSSVQKKGGRKKTQILSPVCAKKRFQAVRVFSAVFFHTVLENNAAKTGSTHRVAERLDFSSPPFFLGGSRIREGGGGFWLGDSRQQPGSHM